MEHDKLLSNDHTGISASMLEASIKLYLLTVRELSSKSSKSNIKITWSDAVDDSKEGIPVPPAWSKVVHLNPKLLAHLGCEVNNCYWVNNWQILFSLLLT